MITLTLTLNRLGGIKCLAFVLFVRLYACFSNSVLFNISLKRALQKRLLYIIILSCLEQAVHSSVPCGFA